MTTAKKWQKEWADKRQDRFERFVDKLVAVIGHADREDPLRAYCRGLLLPGDRKSVEPIAARVEPERTGPRHQQLLHFIAESPWSSAAVIEVASGEAIKAMEGFGGIEAWIVDDTGNPKKGTESVGVAKQYCGVLGKTENCQVAVTLSVASEMASVPVAHQLYLPESWAHDPIRRKKAKVPKEIEFQTKPEISLGQIRAAVARGIEPGCLSADAGYGNNTGYRDALTEELHLQYMLGVQESTTVWPEGATQLRAPTPKTGQRGRPPQNLKRQGNEEPVSCERLAMSLPASAYQSVSWREGTKGVMQSRFATVRVRAASREERRRTLRDEEWLLIEWPVNEKKPIKYWLSTLPKDFSLNKLVHFAMLRWRIERDYQELKDEIGLDHFEGRSWRGFHHHAALCIAAYAFLAAERLLGFSPLRASKAPPLFEEPALPQGFRPRGSPERKSPAA